MNGKARVIGPTQRITRRLLILAALFAALGAVAVKSPSPSRTTSTAAKRGVASAKFLSSDPAILARVHPAWAYDWSWEAPPAAAIEWVPMLWGPGA